MIVASTGFSASSRVITTSNQMIQELLNSQQVSRAVGSCGRRAAMNRSEPSHSLPSRAGALTARSDLMIASDTAEWPAILS